MIKSQKEKIQKKMNNNFQKIYTNDNILFNNNDINSHLLTQKLKLDFNFKVKESSKTPIISSLEAKIKSKNYIII